jgi:hypothetical protein
MSQLESNGGIAKLPAGTVEPVIVTGIEALGRDHDLEKLMQVVQIAQAVPSAAEAIDWSNWLSLVLTNMGIDKSTGIIKTAAQQQQEAQQAGIQQAAQAGLQSAAETAGQQVGGGTNG